MTRIVGVLLSVLVFLWLPLATASDKDGIAHSSVQSKTLLKLPSRVLLLLSYDPLFQTSDAIVDAVREVLEHEDIRLSIEYMDSKGLWAPEFIEPYASQLQYKLSKLPQFDLIISSDDNALRLMTDHRPPALKDVPLVFIGVNNVGLMNRGLKENNATGILEEASITETLNLATRYFPEAESVVVITDGTPSGKAVYQQTQREQSGFPAAAANISTLSLAELSWEELLTELSQLKQTDIVYLQSAYADKFGKRKSLSDSVSLVTGVTNLPVFHLAHHSVGMGVLGGVMIDLGEQARIASRMALKILSGTPVSNIEPLWESPNSTTLDFNIMQAHGLKVQDVADNVHIINLPESWLARRGWSVEAVLAAVISILILLWMVLLHRAIAQKTSALAASQQELLEQEKKFSVLFNGVPESIFVIDPDNGRLVEFNEQAYQSLGYTEEEFTDFTLPDLKYEETLDQIHERVDQVMEKGIHSFSTIHKTKSGEKQFVRIRASLIKLGGKRRVVSVISDVTEELQRADFLTSLINTAPIGIGTVVNEKIQLVNKGLCEKFGLSENVLLNTSPEMLCPSRKVYENNLCEIKEQLKHNSYSELETVLVAGNGDKLDVLLRHSYLNPQSPEDGWVFTILDITERKKVESRMWLLSQIVEQSSDALLITDAEFRITHLNNAFKELSGYTLEDLEGKSPHVLNANPSQEEQQQAIFDELVAKGKCSSEILNRHKDGSTFLCQFWVSPIHDQQGEIIAYMGSQRDVTESRRAETELISSEVRYRTLLEEIPQGVVVANAAGKVLSVNPAAEGILGRNLKNVSTVSFLSGSERASIFDDGREFSVEECPLTEILKTGRPQRNRVIGVFNPKKEEHVWINLDALPFLLPEAEEKGHVLIIFSDVSESRTLQRALVQAQRMEAVGQLTGGIAHDFNNILASILGFADLANARFSAVDPKLEKYLTQIVSGGQRARDLVRQLLIFSRGGSRRGAEFLNLSAELEDVIAMLRPMIPASIDIVTRFETPSPIAVIDPLHLQQVLMNLSINACDAMENEGVLTISLSSRQMEGERCVLSGQEVNGEWAQISVSDTGPGIAPHIRNSMFQPFTSTKEAGKGTGMGLAVVHGIMKTYRGNLLLESSAEFGTCFLILLPLVSQNKPVENLLSDSGLPACLPGGKRILVVDDEPGIRAYLEDLLKVQGATAVCCESVSAAQKTFFADPEGFDAIITDQTMPGLSGIRLIESIRTVNREVPVILCSGHRLELEPNALALLNISEVFLKPVQANELITALAAVLSSSTQTA